MFGGGWTNFHGKRSSGWPSAMYDEFKARIENIRKIGISQLRNCTHSHWNAIINPLSKRGWNVAVTVLFFLWAAESEQSLDRDTANNKLYVSLIACCATSSPSPSPPFHVVDNFTLLLACVFRCCRLPC